VFHQLHLLLFLVVETNQAEAKPAKKEEIVLIDPKKAYNLSIFLGRLKLSCEEWYFILRVIPFFLYYHVCTLLAKKIFWR
jgi:hypothetical protein